MKYPIDLKQFKNTHPGQCRLSINGSSLYWEILGIKRTQVGKCTYTTRLTLDVASYPHGCLSQLYRSQRCASRQNTVWAAPGLRGMGMGELTYWGVWVKGLGLSFSEDCQPGSTPWRNRWTFSPEYAYTHIGLCVYSPKTWSLWSNVSPADSIKVIDTIASTLFEWVSGTVLGALHTLFHYILSTTLRDCSSAFQTRKIGLKAVKWLTRWHSW